MMVIGKQQKPPLLARQYRELWLEDAHRLGLIGECLAEALGWQPSEAAPLPDAVELAQAAAEHIISLEAQAVFGKITRRATEGESRAVAFSVN